MVCDLHKVLYNHINSYGLQIQKGKDFMNYNNILNDEIKQKIIEKAIEKIGDPFENLTVKQVAKDLLMGENKANELFARA